MEYTVIRSSRRTLCLSFDRAENLVVRAPMRTSDEQIAAFVARHRQWIAKHKDAYRNKFSLADGSFVTLCGKNYTVCTGKTHITKEKLFLPAENRQAALLAVCRKLTKTRMQDLTERIAAQYGFCYTKLRITAARTRWGSCSGKGHIRYSLYGAFLPDPLAAYLAVHELCHTRHLDHSAAFWKEVENILPDFARRRAELKKYQFVFQI